MILLKFGHIFNLATCCIRVLRLVVSNVKTWMSNFDQNLTHSNSIRVHRETSTALIGKIAMARGGFPDKLELELEYNIS